MPKFYVVWNGREKGIFDSWETCRLSVVGFTGAKFKSFNSRIRAESEYGGNVPLPPEVSSGIGMALTVDGACDGTLGEFRGVLIPSCVETFRSVPFKHATNNVMEYLAIIRGLMWMDGRGLRIPLYSDSKIAIAWVSGADNLCHTCKSFAEGSETAREIIKYGGWLRSRTHKVGLLACLRKWDTITFGEIPADFGRK
jgi:ribonuclease HI